MKEKKIFNTVSEEKYNEAKIINGNPNGIINFNATNHAWATSLYKKMLARSWFAEQVNVSKDKVNYPLLSAEEKRTYDLILAQLITNDSIQTNQLMDKFNSLVTSPVVNACLSRQAYEESQHSNSYSVMAEDICQDTDRLFNLQHHDEELAYKNNEIEKLYMGLYIDGKDITTEDFYIACIANQILEALIFPVGFVAMFSMGDKMPGTCEMIAEICKD